MTPLFTETRLRVRYAETDQMNVVYYSNYLVWMEIGRTDFCLESGFRYRDMEEKEGVMIAVVEARCRYRRPARYDDEVVIRTRLDEIRRRTLTFSYEILHAASGELLAEGSTVHVAIDRDTRPCAIPDRYREMLSARRTIPRSES